MEPIIMKSLQVIEQSDIGDSHNLLLQKNGYCKPEVTTGSVAYHLYRKFIQNCVQFLNK